MDYKNKYNDALDRARGILFGDPNSNTANTVCEIIFPELKNERISKEIIDAIRARDEKTPTVWLEWLEEKGNLKEDDKKDDIVARYPCAGDPIPCGINCDNTLSNEGVMDRYEILMTIKDQMINGKVNIVAFTKWLQEFIDKEIGNTPLIRSY